MSLFPYLVDMSYFTFLHHGEILDDDLYDLRVADVRG